MRIYFLAIIVMGLLVCALGCPQTKEPTASTPSGSSAVGADPATETQDAPVAASADESPEAAETAETDNTATEGEPAPEADTEAPKTASQISGTWLALFGRGDQGVNEQAYFNGHKLQFEADGTVLLTLLKDGKPGRQLPGTFTIENGRLEWTYALAAAVDSGAIDFAPLGMGRDEEIGLLNSGKEGMGRDDEIGLLTGEKEGMGRDVEIGLSEGGDTEKSGSMKHTEELRIVLDGPFMALTDDHGQIYVYGNADLANPAPLHHEQYSGSFEGKQITATFTENSGTVEGQLGEHNGWFKGEAADGFFIGRIEGLPRLSLAALVPAKDGRLSGVLLSDPYAKLNPSFDFTPQK